jgi:hypothetical protein
MDWKGRRGGHESCMSLSFETNIECMLGRRWWFERRLVARHCPTSTGELVGGTTGTRGTPHVGLRQKISPPPRREPHLDPLTCIQLWMLQARVFMLARRSCITINNLHSCHPHSLPWPNPSLRRRFTILAIETSCDDVCSLLYDLYDR